MTTMTTPATPTITDTRFSKLKAKLRELFELDKSDLDFGIYRIMAAKNKEVTDFLDRQLKDVVKQTLTEHGAGATDALHAELDEMIAGLRKAKLSDEQIEASDGVKDLREKLAAAGGKTGEELEADIYNHLLAFFGRYYDEGDFISQRRYKGDTYAIPYSGEEVMLHWANKDQYYIKSGEWHKDYRFKLPDGRRVRFALVDATQETGNNKEPDEAKRRYILVDDQPVVAEGDTLTLRFNFRAPTEGERERAADGAVAIFGGKYAKSTKGDERERFCADAEKRAIPNIPEAWAAAVLAESKTDAKPLRTLLGKHLDAFTARNTFDYFIHKDLGGFLRRELDFYIKNEVVRLDDLDAAPAEHLQRVQGRVRAIRRVASKVIELLESLENFQKKLWLKKKFVLNTSWLVTVDRVPERLRDTAAENAEQWAEWERLGFKPEGEAGGLFGGAEWGTRAYLDACDKLVVDTRLFDEAFTAELLASEEVLHGGDSLDDATVGILCSSDNFQALGAIAEAYQGRVPYIYIDPPYNAKTSEIPYKNTFKHAAWLTMMGNRLRAAEPLLAPSGCLTVAIDENEQQRLELLLKDLYPLREIACISVIHNPAGVQGRNFSYTHESAIFVYPEDGEHIGYTERDDDLVSQLRDWGGTSARSLAKNCFYPIIVRGNEIIDFGPRCEDDFHPGKANVAEGDLVYVYPVEGSEATGDYSERKWVFSRNTVEANKDQLFVRRDGDEVVIMRRKSLRKYRTVWDDKRYYANIYGSKALTNVMGSLPFPFPKAIPLVEDCIKAIVHTAKDGAVVLDYFAGSGTTGHAVLSLNRSTSVNRRFVLVEMGEYFNTVLRPRVTKVVYSPDWKDGTAKTHDQGLSALVKCFAVESYEDALNNLPTPTGGMFDGRPAEEADALIRYALDLEMGPHLLDLDIFRDPWGHAINAQLAGDDEIKRHRVDLVETFNYLLGLRVSAYGPIERYSAEFERAEHDDGLGRLKLTGRLRRDPDGPFKFQRVEGILNDGNDTRVLVVWRTLTGHLSEEGPEQDAAVLDAWMARHREATTERTEHRDYHQIYINGPVTLPQPTAEIRTVYPIEEAFKRRMFEDTEDER